MTQLFDEAGNCTGVTLVEIEPVCTLEKVTYPTKERVRIGVFKVPEKRLFRVKKPQAGYFKKLGSESYKMIKEVLPDPAQEFESLKKIGIELFSEGEKVDIQATVKGRGFQGGMKRHGWSGQPGGHGSTMHRRLGSAGACATPSKIIKGIKMPGHMGNCLRTIKNIEVLKIDKERNILFLKGSLPGSPNSVIKIRKK